MTISRLEVCCVAICMLASITHAASTPTTAQSPTAGLVIDQNLNVQVPADLNFIDDHNQSVQLASYFNSDKPLILVLAFYSCPSLCPLSLHHMAEALNGIAPTVGTDFDILVVSFDPHDTPTSAAPLKSDCVRAYRRAGTADGWHFLTGSNDAIESLTKTVGFNYRFDEKTKSFSHAAGIMILSPTGRTCHYFFGIDYAPADLSDALRDAAKGVVTQTADSQQQFCLTYSLASTPRGLFVSRLLKTTAVVWIILLAVYITTKSVRASRAGGTAHE